MRGLGFRNVQSINIAMLSKQCWRILKEPSFLMSKLLKQKYFSNSDFLMPNWVIILHLCGEACCLDIISSEMAFYGGLTMEKKTKIWKDKWINSPISNSIQSPNQLLAKNTLVAKLIDHEAHYWKQDLIHQIFSSEEVRAINAILLSIIDKEDLLVWSPVKNGLFLVKSVYHFHHFTSITNKDTFSTNRIPPFVWKTI